MNDEDKFLGDFLGWLRIGHSIHTVSSYKYSLYPFIKWLKKTGRSIDECEINDISKYAAYLWDLNLRSSTVSLYMTALKTYWTWLETTQRVKFSKELIPHVPVEENISYPVAHQEDVVRILKSYGNYFPDEIRDRAAVALLWDTGMRIGEMLQMNLQDIDLENKKSVIRTFKRRKHFREVYWENSTNDMLKHWIAVRRQCLLRHPRNIDALFISLSTNTSKERLDRHLVQKSMRKRCEMLNIIPNITPHSLRHGFATLRLKQGFDIRSIQELLGHAKITTTQIYTQVEAKELERMYRDKYYSYRYPADPQSEQKSIGNISY